MIFTTLSFKVLRLPRYFDSTQLGNLASRLRLPPSIVQCNTDSHYVHISLFYNWYVDDSYAGSSAVTAFAPCKGTQNVSNPRNQYLVTS